MHKRSGLKGLQLQAARLHSQLPTGCRGSAELGARISMMLVECSVSVSLLHLLFITGDAVKLSAAQPAAA